MIISTLRKTLGDTRAYVDRDYEYIIRELEDGGDRLQAGLEKLRAEPHPNARAIEQRDRVSAQTSASWTARCVSETR